MVHRAGSFYHDIEYRAAVNFIETVIIFIIIGVLFILLFFQLQRSRLMRSKEKEFVASVTHELRTPLTVIRSAADNLNNGIVSEDKLQVYGGLITEQSDRLSNMIEEILLYSKFEDKRRKPDAPVKVNFEELVTQIRPILDTLASSEGIKLNWDTKGLPETGMCHPEIISLALNNLVANAVNHAYSETSSGERH